MTVQESQHVLLPPSPFVKRLNEVVPYTRLDVLDVGCCMGRNAIFLANHGHNVIGVDVAKDDIKFAKQHADNGANFVVADARNLPFRNRFDLVLLNEVLHQIPREEHVLVMRSLKAVTKPGGLHAVSGYVGDKPAAFQPMELHAMYANTEWEIIESTQDDPNVVCFGDHQELTSLATVVALKK